MCAEWQCSVKVLGLYLLARAGVTKYHNLGGYKQKLFHVSRDWKSEIRMSTGLPPSEGSGGTSVPCLLPTSGVLLATFGIPSLVETLPKSLPSSSHCILPVCVSVLKMSLFTRTPVM